MVDYPVRLVDRDLHAAARLGLDAAPHWDGSDVPDTRSILDVLLPLAEAGLDTWSILSAERDRYLWVVAQWVRSGQTGSRRQIARVRHLEQRAGLDRRAAVREEMTRRYAKHSRTGAAVHDRPIPCWHR